MVSGCWVNRPGSMTNLVSSTTKVILSGCPGTGTTPLRPWQLQLIPATELPSLALAPPNGVEEWADGFGEDG